MEKENALSIADTINSQAVHLPQNESLQLNLVISTEEVLKIEYTKGNSKIHLFQAVKLGQVKTVHVLLALEPDWIHLKTPSGMTLLHLAVQENQWPVAEQLLLLGANIDAQNEKGAGLLHSAIQHPVLMKQLIQRAPRLIEVRDKQGNTPLHYAATLGLVESLKVLIEHKAWREAKNQLGQTPLHAACEKGQTAVVEYLLNQGVNYQALDKEGRLPAAVAKLHKHYETALLFAEYKEQFTKRITSQEAHKKITGELTKTAYYLLDELYSPEIEDFTQQTNIKLSLNTPKAHVWSKKGGNFGQVGLARNADTGQFVAVKEITGEDKIQESLHEGKIQKHLEGLPNLMPLFDYRHDEQNGKIYQFMLYAELGDGEALKQPLAQLNQPELLLTQPLIYLKIFVHIAKSLLTGLNALYQAGFSHSDLKSNNILIDRSFHIYLSDFGCTHPLNDTKEIRGYVPYFSPEKLAAYKARNQNQPYTYSPTLADSWALGLTLLDLTGYFHPSTYFKSRSMTPELIINIIQQLDCLKQPGLFEFIQALLHPNPKKRLTIQAALQHPLIQNPLYQFTEVEQHQALKLLQLTPESKIILLPIAQDSDYLLNPPTLTSTSILFQESNLNSYGVSPEITIASKATLFSSNANGEELYKKGYELEQKLPEKEFQKNQPEKIEEIIQLYQKAAQLGYGPAHAHLSRLYLAMNQIEKAYPHLLKAAEAKDKTAMYSLAQMLETGTSVPKDSTAALYWYEQLSLVTTENEYASISKTDLHHKIETLKNVIAEELYQKGYELEKKLPEKAFKKNQPEKIEEVMQLYQKSAQLGHVSSHARLSRLYLAMNQIEKAYPHLVKAAEAKDKTAMYNLAQMFETGTGVPKDKTTALYWYEQLSPVTTENEYASISKTDLQHKIETLKNTVPQHKH